MKLRHAVALALVVLAADSCAWGHEWEPKAYQHPWLVSFIILIIILALASIGGGRSNGGSGGPPLPPDPPN